MRLPQGSATLAWCLAILAVSVNGTSLALVIGVNRGVVPVPPLFSAGGEEITPAVAVLGAGTVAVLSIVGGLLGVRRPDNPIGWLFAACGLAAAGYYLASQYATAALITRTATVPGGVHAAWLAQWLWVVAFGLLMSLLLLFPDGRLPSRRWRPVGWLVAAVLSVLALLLALTPGPLSSFPAQNPVGVNLLSSIDAQADQYVRWLWLGLPAVALASLVARYRGSGQSQRQQLKYLVVAATLMVVAVAVHQTQLLPAPLGYVPLFAAATSLPIGVCLAILRYGLYEIDHLVSRTVSYGMLTVLLVAVYLAVVFGLQTVLRPLAGESQLAVAGATLAVAALFGPARRRLQAVVDRRFNRARYDAQRTVDEFRARLRDEVDLDQLGTELVGAVQKTVEPAEVSVWLRPPGDRAKS